jgi:hypothetical protein
MLKASVRTGALILFILGLSTASAVADGSYAEDRALIEDLAARYLFALDFDDAEAYANTFTEDGILDYGRGEIKGRKAIYELINRLDQEARAEAEKDTSGLHRATGRHNISNMVIKVEGNTARMVAYWFHHGNNNPERKAAVTSYGHYVDELVKVNGQWLFSKRKIYNEQVKDWVAPPGNPSW